MFFPSILIGHLRLIVVIVTARVLKIKSKERERGLNACHLIIIIQTKNIEILYSTEDKRYRKILSVV